MFLHEQKQIEILIDPEDGFLSLKQDENIILISPLYVDIFIELLNQEIKGS